MAEQQYKHFNPKEHQIETKIATVKSGHHTKFNINYHLIWIPKYRKPILKGEVKNALKGIINECCYTKKLDLLALEIMPDHIHLFVGAKPSHTPSQIVKYFKGCASKKLRERFPDLAFLGYKKKYKRFPALWARGYYCGTAGHVSQEQVRRYIEEQQGKDLFSYSIYGHPDKQLKIGDFTR